MKVILKVTKSLKRVDAHVSCHKVALLDWQYVLSWMVRIFVEQWLAHIKQHKFLQSVSTTPWALYAHSVTACLPLTLNWHNKKFGVEWRWSQIKTITLV